MSTDFYATTEDLLRAIAAGEISANRDGAQRVNCWRNGQLVPGRQLASKVQPLIVAGLVRPIPFLAPDVRLVRLTGAGRDLLAAHGGDNR